MPTLLRADSANTAHQDVLAVEKHLPFRAQLRIDRIDAVENAQQRRLSQPEGPMIAVTLCSATCM
jgi:hypothetical protein